MNLRPTSETCLAFTQIVTLDSASHYTVTGVSYFGRLFGDFHLCIFITGREITYGNASVCSRYTKRIMIVTHMIHSSLTYVIM